MKIVLTDQHPRQAKSKQNRKQGSNRPSQRRVLHLPASLLGEENGKNDKYYNTTDIYDDLNGSNKFHLKQKV